MPARNFALGTLSPIIYFENSRGTISLPPTTDDALRIRDVMRRRGYDLREAGTLTEIDRLQRRLEAQLSAENQAALASDDSMRSTIKRTVYDRLRARAVSSSTSEYERDFITEYLRVSYAKRDRHQAKFTADQAYFTAREFSGSAAKHHLLDATDRVPSSAETACQRCHNYRKVQGSSLCFRCSAETAGAISG